jgi:predicted  nucleic acid-binding Zn-ribbon protein
LSKNRVARRAIEAAQGACVTELERVNAELRVEVKQTHLKIAEAEEHQNSLHSGYSRLEDEGEGLRNATETLNREKVEAEVAHEVEVTGIHTKFQDSCAPSQEASWSST